MVDSPVVTVKYTHLGTGYEKEKEGKVSVLEGDSLWMTCDHEANPPSRVLWKVGRPEPKVVIGHEEEVLLNNITRDSAASYYCIAENIIGKTSTVLDVTVMCKYSSIIFCIQVTLIQTPHTEPELNLRDLCTFLSKKV